MFSRRVMSRTLIAVAVVLLVLALAGEFRPGPAAAILFGGVLVGTLLEIRAERRRTGPRV